MKQPFLPVVLMALVLLLSCGCTRYYAKSAVEYGKGAAADEAALRALLPSDPSVTLNSIRGTGLYEIGVYDRDPKMAAKRANDLTIAVRKGLMHTPAGLEFKIWQKAEPPQEHKWPWNKR